MMHNIKEFRNIASHADLPSSLVPEIECCIQSAFGGGITREDARHHMEGTQVLIAENAVIPGNVLGFSSSTFGSPRELLGDKELEDISGIYFAGAAIRLEAQSTGLYHELNRNRLKLLDEYDVDYVYTRTQNPRVEEGITSAVQRLCEERQYKGYKIGHTVCKGAYGKMLTLAKPNGRAISYDHLNYQSGDALVVSWQISK